MLKLSKEDRKQLRKAINSGFRKYPSLEIFVSDNFDHFRLNEIVTSTALKVAADDLIKHFEEEGDLSVLILALYEERPRNPEVQSLVKRLQDFLQQRLVLDPSVAETISLPFEFPGDYDDTQLESFLPRRFSYEADVGKLRRGLQLANAICKVSFTDRATTGTGVLIAPDLVLTNYHVLSRQVVEDRLQLAEKAKTLLFEFGFVSEEHETPVSPDTFAIDATSPVVAYRAHLRSFGFYEKMLGSVYSKCHGLFKQSDRFRMGNHRASVVGGVASEEEDSSPGLELSRPDGRHLLSPQEWMQLGGLAQRFAPLLNGLLALQTVAGRRDA